MSEKQNEKEQKLVRLFLTKPLHLKKLTVKSSSVLLQKAHLLVQLLHLIVDELWNVQISHFVITAPIATHARADGTHVNLFQRNRLRKVYKSLFYCTNVN